MKSLYLWLFFVILVMIVIFIIGAAGELQKDVELAESVNFVNNQKQTLLTLTYTNDYFLALPQPNEYVMACGMRNGEPFSSSIYNRYNSMSLRAEPYYVKDSEVGASETKTIMYTYQHYANKRYENETKPDAYAFILWERDTTNYRSPDCASYQDFEHYIIPVQ